MTWRLHTKQSCKAGRKTGCQLKICFSLFKWAFLLGHGCLSRDFSPQFSKWLWLIAFFFNLKILPILNRNLSSWHACFVVVLNQVKLKQIYIYFLNDPDLILSIIRPWWNESYRWVLMMQKQILLVLSGHICQCLMNSRLCCIIMIQSSTTFWSSCCLAVSLADIHISAFSIIPPWSIPIITIISFS